MGRKNRPSFQDSVLGMMKICTYHKSPLTYPSLVNTQRQCYSKIFNEKIQPIPIVVSIEKKLSPEMDVLRLRCFPGVIPLDTSRDEFDDRSEHLVIKIRGVIAAYGRLTPGRMLSSKHGHKG
jgi:hypothetical protein